MLGELDQNVWEEWKGGYFHIFRDFNNWTLHPWRNVALKSFQR